MVKGIGGGGTYDDMAEYLNTYITSSEVQTLLKTFSDPEFKNHPQKIMRKLNAFFDEKWQEGVAGGKPQPAGRAETQRKNFEKGLKKAIFDNKNPERVFKTRGGDIVDFDPLFQEDNYLAGLERDKRDIQRKVKAALEEKGIDTSDLISFEELKDKAEREGLGNLTKNRSVSELKSFMIKMGFPPTDVAKYSDKQVEQIAIREKIPLDRNIPLGTASFLAKGLKGKRLGEDGGKKKKTFIMSARQYERNALGAMQRADDGRNLDSLLAIKSQLQTIYKTGEGPIDSIKAYSLLNQLERKLEKYRQKTHLFSFKSDDRLKDLLSLKGVDTSKLKSSKSLRSEAKKLGIGVRQFEKTRDDQILELTSLIPSITKEQIEQENWTTQEIASKIKANKRLLGTSKPRIERVQLNKIVPREEEVKEDFAIGGLGNFENAQAKLVRQETSRFPFLTTEAAKERANKKLFAQARGLQVYDEEVIRRFLKYDTSLIKKGKQEKVEWRPAEKSRTNPSYDDLVKLSKISWNDFKFRLADDPNLPRDQRYLSKDKFKAFRDNLRGEIKKSEDIRNLMKEQEEEFIASEVEKIQNRYGRG